MNIVAATYNDIKKFFSYNINPGFTLNCKKFESDSLVDFKLLRNSFLFIGLIYDGVNMGLANSLSQLAALDLQHDFYFKFVFDEMELEKFLGKELEKDIPPLIVYNDYENLHIIS